MMTSPKLDQDAGAPSPAKPAPQASPQMLLLEPNLVARRTISTVVHELRMARVEEVADVDAAAARLQVTRYAAMLIDLGHDQAAMDLITRVHQRQFPQNHNLAVVAMAPEEDPATRRRLGAVEARMLVRPFKVRAVLEVLRSLPSEPV